MQTVARYCLVGLCSTVLLMPPCDACCLARVLPLPGPKATAATAPADTSSCCKRCHPSKPQQPAPPAQCVCVEKTGIASPERSKMPLASALLPLAPTTTSQPSGGVRCVTRPLTFGQSLHLWHCVWLC